MEERVVRNIRVSDFRMFERDLGMGNIIKKDKLTRMVLMKKDELNRGISLHYIPTSVGYHVSQGLINSCIL